MEKTTKTTVSKITIGRLYNLGSYEHIRYEISVDLEQGGEAATALITLERIISALSPKAPHSKNDQDEAARILATPSRELTEWEQNRLAASKRIIAENDKHKALRLQALADLEALGGSSQYTDAKEHWDEDRL